MIELDFKKSGGLIPAIAQDWKTGEVLMLAYINEESWKETLRTGHGVYWSRSRSKLWHKGEESGNVQIVKEILPDLPEQNVSGDKQDVKVIGVSDKDAESVPKAVPSEKE